MQISTKLVQIGKKLSSSSYLRLSKVAQQVQQKGFDLNRARKVAPQYWRGMKLDRYRAPIQQVLNTAAQPGTDQFYQAVYQYQVRNPGTGMPDGIVGPKTFKYMTKMNPEPFKQVNLTEFDSWLNRDRKDPMMSRDPSKLWGKELQDEVKRLGLVSLEGVAPIKNYPYAHPKLRQLLENITQAGYEIWRVTEAFPPTVRHISRTHYNGRAIDFTLKDPSQADALAEYIKRIPGFRVANEYRTNYETSVGSGHMHVAWEGDESQLVS